MTETKTPNLVAKSALARLMAAENITVNVDGKAPTAMFDVENRVLTLPLWEVDGDAYDMLVGHEVSHALHTPAGAESLLAACDAIDPKNRAVAKDYLNVVEDARIERLIKADYPGLRRSFATGYREFLKRDLFKIKDKLNELAKLPLIDRVNLHYKVGWLINVPFTDVELPIVRRVAETRSWAEVVALSKELYEFAKKQESDKDSNQDSNESSDETESESGEGEESPETESGEGNDASNDGDETDADGDESQSSSAAGESGEGSESGESVGDGTAEGEDNEDDGSTAEGKDGTAATRTGSEASNGKTNDNNSAPSASETMRNLEKGLGDLVKISKSNYVYADVPEVPENFVVPLSEIELQLNKSPSAIEVADAVFTSWKTNNISNVQALSSEFERRKAADAHKRTLLSDTGSIDPDRLHAYRVSDDIFLRSSTLRDGKNHGIVLLLDMSGSMSHIMHDTMVQLVNLVAFARRVNIPYKVYGFVDTVPAAYRDKKVVWNIKRNTWRTLDGSTRLLTLFESGMSQQRFQRMVGHCLAWTCHMSMGYGNNRGKNVSPIRKDWYGMGGSSKAQYNYYAEAGLKLNGTPLNTALLSLLTLVPKFKKEKNVQVVNTIILTDGEASDPVLSSCNQVAYDDTGAKTMVTLRDPVTRREYPCFEKSKTENMYYSGYNTMQQTEVICAALRDRTGSKVICIDLVAGLRDATIRIQDAFRGLVSHYATRRRGMRNTLALSDSDRDSLNQIEALRKAFNKNGYALLPNANGYDVRIVLDGTVEEFDDTFDNLTVDASSKAGQRELQKAFQKSLASRKTNRPLMEKIADLIAKGL